MSVDEVRELLPEEMRTQLDGIANQTILGASAHIAIIGDMIEAVARRDARHSSSSEQMVSDVKKIVSYFIRTRGKASRAVRNAVLLMVRGIDGCASLSPEDAAERIISTKDSYAASAKEATERCVSYAVKLAADMDTICVFDYSSTVDRFLERLSEDGRKRKVIIPESRIIDGGYPFLKTCAATGYVIRFVPDAAILDALKGCNAVFMGAETFYPDGTGFNTLGSDVVGVLCSYLNIPLYFITPMVKLDVRSVFGDNREAPRDDLFEKYSTTFEVKAYEGTVDFSVPELVGVPPSQIRAFITEHGIIPSGQMFSYSMKYAAYLDEDGCGFGEEGDYIGESDGIF